MSLVILTAEQSQTTQLWNRDPSGTGGANGARLGWVRFVNSPGYAGSAWRGVSGS